MDLKIQVCKKLSDRLPDMDKKKSEDKPKRREDKPKRPPNKWQLYLKECLPSQSDELSMGDKVSACSIEYNTLKETDPKALDELIESIKLKK